MHSVFIVDDHPVIRLALRMLLENEGYRIAGESDNGVDAMQMVRESPPDLVILDIGIPRLDGLEVLSRFNTMSLSLKILVLTAQSPALFAIRCMLSGACGYVCKQEDLSELLSAIRAVLSGYNYFPSQAISPLRQQIEIPEEIDRFKSVNDRELMVLQLFAQGRSNKEIAEGMFLSNKTVSTYKKHFHMYTSDSTSFMAHCAALLKPALGFAFTALGWDRQRAEPLTVRVKLRASDDQGGWSFLPQERFSFVGGGEAPGLHLSI